MVMIACTFPFPDGRARKEKRRDLYSEGGTLREPRIEAGAGRQIHEINPLVWRGNEGAARRCSAGSSRKEAEGARGRAPSHSTSTANNKSELRSRTPLTAERFFIRGRRSFRHICVGSYNQGRLGRIISKALYFAERNELPNSILLPFVKRERIQ
jgi:hypothetical protein